VYDHIFNKQSIFVIKYFSKTEQVSLFCQKFHRPNKQGSSRSGGQDVGETDALAQLEPLLERLIGAVGGAFTTRP
jgi:hypothetical protein